MATPLSLTGRLNCNCVFTESAAKLKEQLDTLDNLIKDEKYKQAIRQTSQALALLREEHYQHVTVHLNQVKRALVEDVKYRDASSSTTLQTSAWSMGQIDALWNPTSDSQKKKKSGGKKKGASKKQKKGN